MKIVYLTWGETPRAYGVFGSQVIGQFLETSKLSPEVEFHFISAVPIIHSGLIREKWHYFKELKSVKSKLSPIAFHWLPIWTSQNFINSSKYSFVLMHGLTHLHLKAKLKKIQPEIVHCRSYHAAWAALNVKIKYGFTYKIIFDGRGLWPEEVALKKDWSEQSIDYLFLKSIESQLLDKCDCSVSVSDTMHEYYTNLGAQNDHTIYLSADTRKLKVEINEFEVSDTIRFCYVGALSEDTWHKPQLLVELYRKLRLLFPKTQLTIVTTSNFLLLKQAFSEFPTKEIIFTSTKTREELKQVLKKQDFGLMTYFLPENDKEKLLGNMVLAVKTAEYFVAGLPMICNAYCGGASSIIKENGLGVIYYPENIDDLTLEEFIPYLKVSAREKCQSFASENFDYEINAENYKELYQSLMVYK
ncbi:glycosyltransferase [Marinomonas hwangdonensis]|uniref:Glycosyltransferase n=1 Tax=Marinomonas hwangdonensis TaxID=1053647 RepID=A0A3M8Q0W9_9GAMM|nr:glycosyltransferase [Marinomonas hwangdonensis]RNF48804.1 glycosyltransferase [Marinomonas hwangdonensis]